VKGYMKGIESRSENSLCGKEMNSSNFLSEQFGVTTVPMNFW